MRSQEPSDLRRFQILASVRIAYLFELGIQKKVASLGVADFSHPAL